MSHGKAFVITASDRVAAGEALDTSGDLLVAGLTDMGFKVTGHFAVPDGEPVGHMLIAALGAGVDVVVTTGGTGLSPRDLTPEATLPLLDRQLPQLAAAIATQGWRSGVPTATLSRGLAGVAGSTIVVNLPGSVGGVRDGLVVLAQVLPHAVEQIHGGDHVRPAHG